MECPYCRTENAENASKCAACGSWLVEKPPVREWRRAQDGRRVAGVCRGLADRFGVPVAEWLRGGLREQTRALAADLGTWDRRGLLSRSVVQTLVDEHLAGGQNHAFALWGLFCLRLWYEEVDTL